MDVSILSPRALFQKDIRYVVPTFQRPYVWTQDDQWEPLWEDVRNTTERYLDALASLGNERAADAARKVTPHFLGAVVLQQQPMPVVDLEHRSVIDGQQRLTTLQLLLDAAQQVFDELHLTSEARRLAKLVLNDEDFLGNDPDHIFKIWPTSTDRDAFRAAMHNELPSGQFERSRIVQGHEFFQLQIREWLQSSTSDLAGRAAALETTLTGLLQMVVIDLAPVDEAHVIFETLNARGTPLIESDLVKNYVMYSARESGRGEERVYREYWAPLEHEWWREEVTQGRLVRPRLDVFLNYWLSMRKVADVQSSKVFEIFQEYAKPKDIELVAADIRDVAQTYRSLDQVQDPAERAFINRWRVIDAGVITPVLLLLFSASPHELPPQRRVRALRAIESFLVRRMICRLTTKDYNRLTLDLVEVLQREGVGAADEITVNFLRSQTADSRSWPDNQQVKEALLSQPIYRLITRGRLRLVLEAIEEDLRTTKAEQQSVPPSLTIEHIMPQSWRENWPMPSGEIEPELAAAQRDRLVHSIGNLTLVNNRLNPALSNAAWPIKRKAIDEHSVLFLNKGILGQSADEAWDETVIQSRGSQLADRVNKIWPGPHEM